MRAHWEMWRWPWNGASGKCRDYLVLSCDLARSLLTPKWAASSDQRASHHSLTLLDLTWYIPIIENGTFARRKKTDEAVRPSPPEVSREAGILKVREMTFLGEAAWRIIGIYHLR